MNITLKNGQIDDLCIEDVILTNKPKTTYVYQLNGAGRGENLKRCSLKTYAKYMTFMESLWTVMERAIAAGVLSSEPMLEL